MRAKEYAVLYMQDPTNRNLQDILVKFVMEVKNIGQQRHARSDEAFIAIFEEQNQKWMAFVRLVGLQDTYIAAFKDIVEATMNEVFTMWQNYKKTLRGQS